MDLPGGQRATAASPAVVPELRRKRFTHTATDRIETVTDPDGKVTRFTYVDDSELPAAVVCAALLDSDGQRIKTALFPGRTAVTENLQESLCGLRR